MIILEEAWSSKIAITYTIRARAHVIRTNSICVQDIKLKQRYPQNARIFVTNSSDK